jgi:hypothetical protein
LRVLRLLLIGCALGGWLGASASLAGADSGSGGTAFEPAPATPSTPVGPVVPGFKAKIIHGVAYAPSYAPIQVQQLIWAGDAIRNKPYVYGGGHGAWISRGYDCSGSVSYVLHAAGVIPTSMDSSQMMSWGAPGLGQWITVYANPGHAFIQVAGIRLDTSAEQDPHPSRGSGPRWRPLMKRTRSYVARHFAGL